ncbi:S-layer homology domain-containing protein [Microbacteriaceae bacterium VKM Ac-2854]|nr:S-layer homology domain-containing protein [Microbacteriaceae bacterium VKM Ac-2854]
MKSWGIASMFRGTVTAAIAVALVMSASVTASATEAGTSAAVDDTDADRLQSMQLDAESAHPDSADAAADALADPAAAISAAQWQAGNIISDSNYYTGRAMTAAQVQSFLNDKGAACSGALCLKNYRAATQPIEGDMVCGDWTSSATMSAAQIIATWGQLCGVSQKVLLTVLQKESSLVTRTDATADTYTSATGFGCYDGGQCDADQAGFFNQVYWTAYMSRRYLNPSGTVFHYLTYLPGKTAQIDYKTRSTCGSAPVTIANYGTGALYNYTPSQPNMAALANLYGTGDNCSSYGNRNFWTIWSGWFGSPNAVDQFFTDVPAGTPFYADIQWMATYQVSTGTVQADGSAIYKSTDSVSRQAMAAFLFRYSGDTEFQAPSSPSFADVGTDNPFYRAIEWMKAEGISTGTKQANGTVTYSPNNPVSREAMAAFLYRFSGESFTAPRTPSFADVPTSSTFYTQVEWMKSTGISTGSAGPNGTLLYKPSDAVSRQAMAAFLHRYYVRWLDAD